MARRINVVVEADEKGDFNDSARGLDKVASEADKADAALRKMSKGHQVLDSEINKTAHSVKQLRSEFEKTGDVSLLGDADKLERNLKKLQSQFSKTFGDLGKDNKTQLLKAGQDSGEVFTFGLLKTFQTLPPQVQVGLIGAVATAAPVIGGVLNAAVLSAVGGAGLATGIALAARDTRVKSAFADFGQTALEQLDKASQSFVDPLVQAAGKFTKAFASDEILGGLQRSFERLAPLVGSFADGIIAFAKNAMPGIERAVSASLPVLRTLASEVLPQIGNAFGKMFDDIAAGSAGAVDAMRLLGDTISGTLRLIGFTLRGTSAELAAFSNLLNGDFTGAFLQAGNAAQGFSDKLIGILRIAPLTGVLGDLLFLLKGFGEIAGPAGEAGYALGNAAGHAAQQLANAGKAGQEAKAAADALLVSWQGLFSQAMQISNATLGFKEALLGFKDGVKQNSTTLDDNTQKGINNIRMLEGAISKIADWRQANDNGRVSAAYLNDEVARQAGAFRKAALDAGFNRDQVDALISKYLQVPDAVHTNVEAPGLAYNKALAEGYRAVMESINGRVVTSTIVSNQITRYTTVYGTAVENQGSVSQAGGARVIARRHGGIVAAEKGMIARSPTVLFGERSTGEEAYIPKRGIAEPRAAALLNTAASWHGMGVYDRSGPVPAAGSSYTIIVNAPVGASMADAGAEVVEAIKAYEVINGSTWRN